MSDDKLTRKEREFLRHKAEVMHVARDLFAKNGFHNVTMHDIAREAEFSVGKIYKFFPNKEELYTEMVLEKAAEFNSANKKAIAGGKDPMESISAAIKAKVKVLTDNAEYLRIYLYETQGAGFNMRASLEAPIKKKYDEYLQRVAGVFKEGIKKGLFRTGDSYYYALALDGIINSLMIAQIEKNSHKEFDADIIIDLFFNGVCERRTS